MKIAIFGSGYVGLVTGACLADVGHDVVCVDVNAQRIANLKLGIVPIFEPGLADLISRNYAEDRLSFTTDAKTAVESSELIFIAVGTPPDEDGAADMQYVLKVAQTIGENINGYKVVIDKSTVPVGTAERVASTIAVAMQERGLAHDFDVCSNPEFLKEGSAVEDFSKPARIIVGSNSESVRILMRQCYAPYNRNHDKLMFMDVRAAELTKYAANAMLATKISFMNEVANLAERLGADSEQVSRGIGSDPRIGYQFIYPGAGYGGSCFPKDVRALVSTAADVGYNAELLTAVEAVNNRQQETLFTKLYGAFNGDLVGRTIAIWGLSFKPNTDDMRDAPSRRLMEQLWAHGASVQAFDPESMGETRRIYGNRTDLTLCEDSKAAILGADALVVCTEWKQFRVVDFKWLKEALKFPVIVDGRNLYEPEDLKAHGIMYYAVGRGASLATLNLNEVAQKALTVS